MAFLNDEFDRLCVPVMDRNEVVVVPFSELPKEAEETLELLASEAAPLSTWFDFARAYLAEGQLDQFTYLCDEATKEETITEIEKFFGKSPTYVQIQFYCAQAAVHLAMARDTRLAARDPSDLRDVRTRRAEAISRATKLLGQAAALDSKEQLVALGMGSLHLAKGEAPLAKAEFTRASQLLNNGRPNASGLLALAALLFTQREFKQALTLYRRVLRENPRCPAEVRLGIAACLFRLGDAAGAQAAYTRVLQLEPLCADAYLGLATVHFNAPNVQQGLADGVTHLVRAYELDPTHIGVLHLLAQLSLSKGQYDRVLVLGRHALEMAESDSLRADCHTYLARAHHALGQFADAERHYQQASRLDPTLPLPRLGLAQMELRKGVFMNAATELETAIQYAPGFTDALKILGQLHPHNPTRIEKTIAHFKDAAEKRPDDSEIWHMLGELLSSRDPAGSLQAYRKALDLQRVKQQEATKARERAVAAASEAREARVAQRAERQQQRAASRALAKNVDEDDLFGDSDDEAAEAAKEEQEDEDAAVAADGQAIAEATAAVDEQRVAAKLLNNAAVLLFRAGEQQEALELVREAAESLQKGENTGALPLQQVTVSYNQARLQEACGDLKAAKQGYQSIVEQYPEYIDCYLRLAIMAAASGNGADALEWAGRALQREGGHTDALAVMGALHLEHRAYAAAKDALKKLVADEKTKRDSFGRLALGNIRLYQVPTDRRKEEAQKMADEILSAALEEYRSVLALEPSNVFAANGVGAVLAEMGRLDEAKDIFTMVQEASVASGGFLSVPDVVINLANVHLAKQDYATAIYMYKTTLQKHHQNKDPQILLYLARAYYDSNELQQAKQCLLRAIHAAPSDYRLRFNAALTMQEWAVRVYKVKRAPGTLDAAMLERFRQAEGELQMAHRFFEHLRTVSGTRSGIPDKKLEMHVSFCHDAVTRARAQVEHAEREMKEINARRSESDAKLRVAEQERLLQDQRKLHSAELQKLELQRRAAEALERQERLKREWRDKRGLLEADATFDSDGGGGGGEKAAGGKKKGGKGKGEKGGKKGKKGSSQSAWDIALGDGDGEGEPEAGAEEGAEEGEDGGPVDMATLFGEDDDEEEEGGKDLMAQAGLASDDDEDAGRPAAAAGGGRLKRRANQDDDDALKAAGLEDDDDEQADLLNDDAPEAADDADDAFLQDGDEDDDTAAPPPRKHPRTLESDDEDGQGQQQPDGEGGAEGDAMGVEAGDTEMEVEGAEGMEVEEFF